MENKKMDSAENYSYKQQLKELNKEELIQKALYLRRWMLTSLVLGLYLSIAMAGVGLYLGTKSIDYNQNYVTDDFARDLSLEICNLHNAGEFINSIRYDKGIKIECEKQYYWIGNNEK